ncbi:MAG: serine/threonine-protein kinase [Desulfobacteraceae bacterium]|jgi:serine/threonine protein kinase
MEYGRYRIVKELGKGNMGVVYQAHDPKIDRMVALKVLRPDRVTSDAFMARFLKEARAIGRLCHPGIVTVYDVGEDHDTVYIAMEYLQGEPLDQLMQKGRLTVAQSIDVACQVAEALDYAHQQGIVHRDIKPSNIILTRNQKVKLTDFGIARIEDTSAGYQTQAGEILGTPIYMSPEQVMGKKADGRSDLYSVGVILYEVVAGKRPFTGNNLAAIFRSITHDVPEQPYSIDPFISRSLSDVIMKSLNKSPDDRFQNGKALADALAGTDAMPEVSHDIEKKQKKSHGKAIGIMAAAFIALIGIAAGGYYYLSKPAPSPGGVQKDAADVQRDGRNRLTKAVSLKMSSDPQGANVYIDGVFRGKTPLDVQMPTGKYEVRYSLEGYLAWEAQLDLDTPGEIPLNITLRAAKP